MKNKDGKFRFKYFSVNHLQSSMKVGVDGVLVGAWVNPNGKRILDVGTGCGLIALMLAQRNREAEIFGIDVDKASVEEAGINFENSPWRDRLTALRCPFSGVSRTDLLKGDKFDLIVSNPPYFDAGVSELDDSRKIARHQGELSPSVLIRQSKDLVTENGRVAMVIPDSLGDALIMNAIQEGFTLNAALRVRDHEGAPIKRILLDFGLTLPDRLQEKIGFAKEEFPILTMFSKPGIPTNEYRSLCGEFYLKF